MTLEPKLFSLGQGGSVFFPFLYGMATSSLTIGMRNDRWPRHRHLQQKEDSSLDSYIC